MPVYGPPSSSVQPLVIGTGYGMTWTPELRNTPAYSATPVAGPFSGGLLDILQAARLTDLNTIRNAVENNRVFGEDTRKQLNALIADMMSKGYVQASP